MSEDKSIISGISELQSLMEELPVDWLGTGGVGSTPEKDKKEWRKRWDAVYNSLAAAASPVSDAVDMEIVKWCVKRLTDLMKYHINPYNLGEHGEVGSLITSLAKLFKLPPPSSPTPTNVQEQDELWVDVGDTILNGDLDEPETIKTLKQKYTITKNQ